MARRHKGRHGRQAAGTAARAALLAAFLPGLALGQSLTPEGQTLPIYGQSEEGTQAPAGPALAPTEDLDSNARYADGTEASHTPRIAARPGAVRITGSEDEGEGSPATLLADQVTLGADNRLTASGGVVIWYRGARLIASRVIYDNETGAAVIEGPIHLTEPARAGTPQETILVADSAQLDPNMQDGILRGARLVLAREMQMAAREMRRSENGAVTRLDNVVASSCQICAEDPFPLWEIRARAITHDARTNTLHFDRPQFRALGMPIASLPRLTAPDPTVERMTGFLRPQFRTTSGLGFGIKLPYFITLGEHADITLTPYVATSRTRTLELRYRQAFSNGAMEWNGAISRDDIEEGETRGYLFGGARFELPRGYMLGLQIQMASNRAYLLDYDISSADRLWSGLTLDRVRRDRMVMARIGNYESLRDDEAEEFAPSVVADALWKRRWTPGRIGGIASLEWSLHAHRRSSSQDRDGRDMARGSVMLGWQRSEILPGGLVGAAQAQVNADFYRITQDSEYDDWVMRADPTLAVELRWPLARHSGSVTHIIEPVAQLVWSPEREAEDDVPNEDSRLIEFDEGNLFSLNRFPGWDARESGLRANLGVGWTRIDPAGWSIGLTAGRVFRTEPDPAFAFAGPDGPDFTGPQGKKRSDWLLAAHYSGANGLAIANRALFDDSFSISRNELRLGWFQPGLQVSAGYLWLDSDESENRESDVSELTMAGGWQLAQGWWATTETRYDFTADRAQKAQLGLEYRNECITVEMSVERRFTSLGEVRPDTRFDLGIRLGGFGQQKPGPGTVARRACLR
ncbi:LPS-assembly protein LptD [Paracoccus denitrificans]|jgi:LPS-assembly protein|uniref:LPS-assembly protein LptD n=1 Tax=Paracoccus denitrificans (strain Pd 1222) TaxID=318586 RepID=A1B0G7_PARDP|nr:LPS assembly protein LptD [Paracoccus denitrificans]ABL69011.1 Organic solvent tolerance protein [Paracoccus denitrificans PD1222]MBB4625264.1 LPS-assembly protein [Paracoccus denitrificans]MCU7428090.1 LPS assembly protein LptD [Paracoccus denitrificans]QAR27046.1 LPS-assembly protein LptD [Paracoccus denitrificans]UPV96008.1 LPS assembly protein LptD [Paracoccus denitrificans]